MAVKYDPANPNTNTALLAEAAGIQQPEVMAEYQRTKEAGVNADALIGNILTQRNKLPDVPAAEPSATGSMPGVVGSSESVVADERNLTADINRLSAPSVSEQSARDASKAYMDEIDAQVTALEQRRKEEVANIEKSFADAKTATEQGQARERGTTNVALMRTGGYLGTQISGVGVLNNLAATHRGEIASLEAKKAAAITAANNAITDKQFDLALKKRTEIKALDAEIDSRRNKFFDQSMSIIQEQRLQDSAAEARRKSLFDSSLETIDRTAPTIVESIMDMDSAGAMSFIQGAAKDLGLDPNLLAGKVNEIMTERRKAERDEISKLAQKYGSVGIDPDTDTFVSASEKIRNSAEYKLDIQKAELDIANVKSTIANRAASSARARETVDYSSPILKLYSDATGKLVTSPAEARSVNGYAESLLSGKEIVPDDYTGTLLDNQIRESDAKSQLTSAFTNFRKGDEGGLSEADVWSWLATDEAKGKSDDEKSQAIMASGFDPFDFGY